MVGWEVVQDAIETVSGNSISTPGDGGGGSQLRSLLLLVSNNNLTNTQFPERDTGFHRVQRHTLLAVLGPRSQVSNFISTPKERRGRIHSRQRQCLPHRHLCSETGHPNPMIWKER